MGLLGYLPGMRLLGSVHSAYIPMAPSTALSFIALSLILGLYSHRPPTGALHVGCLLIGAAGSFVTFASILMLFGYIYKQPFLYGRDSVVPMALTTAIAFLFLGLAIITGNGPGQLFTRFFAGTSTRSRLLRVFIPLIIFFILVKDGLGALIEANAATLMTLTLLVFMAVTSMVVYWIAGVIGRSIDSAEDDLRESEARFRSVFDQAAVGVARLAADGTWLSVNKKLCDIVGYSHKELLSKTFQEITHPDDLETDLGYLQQLLEDEIQTYSMEKRYYKKSGDLVWINLTVSLVRDINHTPDYLVAIIEDITERKQAEQKLRQSEADLRDAQRMAKMGRWELDIASHRLAWSDSIFEIFEIDPAQFGASYEAYMETVHPEDRAPVEHAYAAALEQRTPYEITHRLLMKDGRIKWLHELCRTEYDSHGEPVRSIGVVRDVTQDKEADERLKLSEKRNRAYLENSPACTKIVDLDFNLQYMSHAGITGLNIDNIEEYYGKPYPLEFYPDSFKVPMRRNLRRAKESGEIITQEAPVVDVDGNGLSVAQAFVAGWAAGCLNDYRRNSL